MAEKRKSEGNPEAERIMKGGDRTSAQITRTQTALQGWVWGREKRTKCAPSSVCQFENLVKQERGRSNNHSVNSCRSSSTPQV